MDRRDGERGWLALAVGAAVVGGALAVGGWLAAHRFEACYRSLGARLPYATQVALTTPTHVAAAGAGRCRRATYPLRSLAAFIVLAPAYIVLALAAMSLPLFELHRTL